MTDNDTTPTAAPAAAPVAAPVADLSGAPLPTADTLRRRQSLPLQAYRFAAFSARIMRMVRKGHH
jgi:hypothetical protein